MIHRVGVRLCELKAMRLLASEDESRFILCGVRIEVFADKTLIIATDGRRLGVLKSIAENPDFVEPVQFTIPTALIDPFSEHESRTNECPECGSEWGIKATDGRALLEYNAESSEASVTACELTVKAFAPTGDFPDWRTKTLPTGELRSATSVPLDPELLATFGEIRRLLGRGYSYCNIQLALNVSGGVLEIRFDGDLRDSFYGLLMPVRWDDSPEVPRPNWLQLAEVAK